MTSDGFDRAPATAGACVMPATRLAATTTREGCVMEFFKRFRWRMRVLWVMSPVEGVTAERKQQQAALEQER